MEGPDDDKPALVVDSGTGVLKAGFAGDDAPRVVFPTLLGTPKSRAQLETLGLKDHYIGDEAQKKRSLLSLQRPMEHGAVTDWEAMERVWQAAFSQLRVSAADQPVLMTEPLLNPTANRENMTQMMFEKFEVPAFSVMTQGVLSLFASGRHMGVMLDCGEGVTHVMPIEGLYVRPHSHQRINLAGGELTAFLQRIMMERGYNVTDSAGLEVARDVKENLCYVAEDFDGELSNAEQSSAIERNYELPDGQVITLNDQRFRVPEALFQPSLLGRDEEGIPQLVYKSIMKCDIDVRALAYNNIILVGGSTMFPGFGARLKKELLALTPPSMRVSVVQPPERKYSVWIGGSIVASLSTFQQMWITKQQYEEYGPAIVHRKCS